MGWTEDKQIEKARNQTIIKDNKLIQNVVRKKFELTAQEQKALGYLLSMIKPEDKNRKPPYTYTFDINTYCDICGIYRNSGSTIQAIKDSLGKLAENVFWITNEKGNDILFQWITTPEIFEGSGKIEVEIPSKIFPYLVNLNKRFTEYELWQILPLKSTYSIAIFELAKSYAYKKIFSVQITDLKAYLGIRDDKYKDFKNFKQKILNVAKREINDLTNLDIEWNGIRDGRNYRWIEFSVKTKSRFDALEAYRRSKAILNGIKHKEGQINIFE